MRCRVVKRRNKETGRMYNAEERENEEEGGKSAE